MGAWIVLGSFDHPRYWEHHELAVSLVTRGSYEISHNGTVFEAFSLPLYPLLLAAVYAVWGVVPAAAAWLQVTLGVITSLVAYALGKRIAGALAGLLAGLGVAVHPGLAVYSAEIHTLNLDALLAALAVVAVVRLDEHPSLRRFIVVGTLLGATLLDRPTASAFVAVAILLVALRMRHRPDRVGAVLALMIGTAMVVPWVIRDQLVVGRSLLTTTAAEVFWIGNNPAASGGALAVDGRPILDTVPKVRDAVWGKPELEQQRIFSDEAFTYVRVAPLEAARRFLGRLLDYWWFSNRTGLLYPTAWTVAYRLWYLAILTAALIGAGLIWRSAQRPLLLWTVAAMAIVSLGQSAFYVEGRHRWEIESLLLVLASVPLAALWRRSHRVVA